MKEKKLGHLAEEIVKYQEKYHLTDAELALTSHFSVERIHAGCHLAVGTEKMRSRAPRRRARRLSSYHVIRSTSYISARTSMARSPSRRGVVLRRGPLRMEVRAAGSGDGCGGGTLGGASAALSDGRGRDGRGRVEVGG